MPFTEKTDKLSRRFGFGSKYLKLFDDFDLGFKHERTSEFDYYWFKPPIFLSSKRNAWIWCSRYDYRQSVYRQERMDEIFDLPDVHNFFYSQNEIFASYSSTTEIESEYQEWKMFSDIVDNFGEFDKVDSIHLTMHKKELRFQILVNIERYDRSLMRELIGVEYELKRANQNRIIDFSYIPIGIVDKEDIIHPKAFCIYEKKNGQLQYTL